MLIALLLMVLLGTTSGLSLKVLAWDEHKRALAGDDTGHRGQYLVITKILLTFIIGTAATLFLLMVIEGRPPGGYQSENGDEWECTGSMRC